MFGYSKNEILNKNVKILCTPAHRDKHDLYVENYLKTSKIIRIILIIYRKIKYNWKRKKSRCSYKRQ